MLFYPTISNNRPIFLLTSELIGLWMNLGIHLARWPTALLAFLGQQGHCEKLYANLVGVNRQTDRMTPSWWLNRHRWGLRFNINVCRLADEISGCEGAFSVAAVGPCQFELDEDRQRGKKTLTATQGQCRHINYSKSYTFPYKSGLSIHKNLCILQIRSHTLKLWWDSEKSGSEKWEESK